jgi:hypothetical protein
MGLVVVIMGWKAIKEYYDIKHHVAYYPGQGICIGSNYVHDLITINIETGKLKPSKIFTPGDKNCNDELNRYWAAMTAGPGKLMELLKQEDVFERSILVYTYHGGEILEKYCEKLGWPNNTHDGLPMYDNTYSADKDKVIFWAKRNASAGVRNMARRIKEIKADLMKAENLLNSEKADLKKLKTDYPGKLVHNNE